jgi:hypothetical protein
MDGWRQVEDGETIRKAKRTQRKGQGQGKDNIHRRE